MHIAESLLLNYLLVADPDITFEGQFLPPANRVCGKVIFLRVSVILSTGGGRVWLLCGGWGWCGMHGCSRGVGGMHGCLGGMSGCSGGVGMVAPGEGACVVAPGAVCVVALGGMQGCSQGGHVWLLPGGMRGIRRDTEPRSMSRRYTSYWNAFL